MPKEVATLTRPAVSPMGNYVLKVINLDENQPHILTFELLDNDNNTIYVAADQFDDQHTTVFLWDDSERVWVYSGDIGTFFWERDGTTNLWEKFTYAETDVTAPLFLKEFRPRWHQQ